MKMMNCNLRRNCVSGSRQAGAMSMTWTNGTSPPPLPWLWLDNRKETYHYCCWFSVWGIFILFSDPKISHSCKDSWNILETDILHSSFNRHLIIFVMVANLVFLQICTRERKHKGNVPHFITSPPFLGVGVSTRDHFSSCLINNLIMM